MTHAPDIADQDVASHELGATSLTRFLICALGAGCLFAIPGLWIASNTAGVPELTLMKLGVSVFLALGGLWAVSFSRRSKA